MGKSALITGITGQDGSYLAERLLGLGYEVHGTMRRTSIVHDRLDAIRSHPNLTIHHATLESEPSLSTIVQMVVPNECYHLAAQSDVTSSFKDPYSTVSMNINGTLYLLCALVRHAPGCRFYFAGSSEMFGGLGSETQNESTPFHPRSPYAISKVAGFELTRHFRESNRLFACSGILFNHESPRRGEDFVTKKIAKAVAEIRFGRRNALFLGNIDPERDWGYAPEYVEAMRLMLNHQTPDDYVIATGETHSVREFLNEAFSYAGMDWTKYVKFSTDFVRPCEVMRLKGDYSKAIRVLGWQPQTRFPELVKLMVDAEMKAIEKSP